MLPSHLAPADARALRAGASAARRAPGRRPLVAMAAVVVAACGSSAARYYPLDPARTWTYAMEIRPAVGQVSTVPSRVTNLAQQSVAGQPVTPQENEAFGQRRIRFIGADDQDVVEIADQTAGMTAPRPRTPPNYIIRAPLRAGATWETTWESNQLGTRTLLPMTKRVERSGGSCTVGGKTFGDCLHLRLSGSGTVQTGDRRVTVDVAGEEWFASGVGYVRGVFAETVREARENDVAVEVTLGGSPVAAVE